MTDQYGADGDHETAGHDEAAEAETWQDDQPPVDDFADQPLEETATVSEEEGELPEDDQSVMVDAKKRSLMLPIAAGLGGMLFLGAVLYWQFGASPSGAPVIKPPPLSTAQTSASPASTPSSAPASNTNSGNADIANLGPASSAAVAPTTALPPTEIPSPSASATAMPAPSPVSAPAAPMPAMLSAETLAKAPPVPMAAPISIPSPPPSTAAAGNNSIDARLNALTTHVEDLQKALAQTTQQLSQISNMVAAKAPLATGSPPPNSIVEERLNKIEQQVLQIQHAEPVTASSPVVTQETSTSVVADATPEKPVAKTGASHKHKVSSKPSHVTHKATSTAGSKPSAHWALRAATPGEAWVSNGESTDEFRHVQVGDSLPGIGRIEAIRQNGDSWVVEGAQGSIR